MGTHALILNASFEPLDIVSWKRAIQLLFQGKVEVVEEWDHEVRTINFAIRIPSVIRLLKYIPTARSHRAVPFTRSNVFLRDHHRCQYCGRRESRHNLTLDHVMPVVQGGTRSWENIVTCCRTCNQRKGGQTPHEAQMTLVRRPVYPVWLPQTTIQVGLEITPEKWKFYLSF